MQWEPCNLSLSLSLDLLISLSRSLALHRFRVSPLSHVALLSPFQFDDDVRRPPRRLQKLQHSSKRRKGDLTLDQLQKKLEAAEKRKKDYEQRILDKISVDVRCYPLVVCLDSSFFLFFSVIFLCQCTLSLTRTQFPSGLQTRRPADRREQQTEEQAKQVEQKVDQKVDKAMVRSSSLPAPCSNPCCFPHPWLVLAFLLLRFLSLLVNHLHVTGAHTCPPSPPPFAVCYHYCGFCDVRAEKPGGAPAVAEGKTAGAGRAPQQSAGEEAAAQGRGRDRGIVSCHSPAKRATPKTNRNPQHNPAIECMQVSICTIPSPPSSPNNITIPSLYSVFFYSCCACSFFLKCFLVHLFFTLQQAQHH